MSTKINYLFTAYVVLWPLISTLFVHIDAAGRMYMILAAIMLILNIKKSLFVKTIKKPQIVIWMLWGIFVTIVWIIKGENSTNLNSSGFIFLKICLPIISMIVAAIETHKDSKKYISFLFILYFIYVLIGFCFEDRSVSAWERGGGVLGNSLPLTAVCACFIASICETKGWIKTFILYICVLLAIGCILTTATRKAFVALILVVAFWYIAKNRINSLKGFLKVFFYAIVGYYLILIVLDNTLLGERMFSLAEEENHFNTTNSIFLDFLGDRAVFYIEGWILFLKNPLCGIGLRNFMVAYNYAHPIHSEYMVQLAETGLIGTTFYVMFYYFLFRLIFRIRKTENILFMIYTGFLIVMLFISLTSWTYEFPRYYVLFGLIIGYCSCSFKSKSYENSTCNK